MTTRHSGPGATIAALDQRRVQALGWAFLGGDANDSALERRRSRVADRATSEPARRGVVPLMLSTPWSSRCSSTRPSQLASRP